MLAFAVVLTHPPTVLFLLFLAYAASGPVLTVIKLRERRSRRASTEDPGQDS
jgi:CDP-diacylglycerol--serine O-phosphatidyltransferase